jgi:hypothetical protein
VYPIGLAASVVAGLVLVSAQTPATPQQTPPVFRAGTTLVPVDVRVIDKDGKPVTDLRASDFTVIEEGVRQEIRHFSTHAFTAESPAPDARGTPAAAKPGAGAPVDDLTPQNRRVFLIVLGRGRLQPPAKGVDGMLHFVREKLLPKIGRGGFEEDSEDWEIQHAEPLRCAFRHLIAAEQRCRERLGRR